jgi:nucleotide-binding universal stress UspA family protein
MLTIRRILVPADCGPCGAAAYHRALPLARRVGAELHLVHASIPQDAVDDDPVVFLPPYPDDVRVVEADVRGQAVAGALVDYAWDHDADLAVVGTHGRRGFAHLFLGSVAEHVVREAPCPVLTVHADAEDASVRRILVPVDFSGRSDDAVRYARELADLYGAKVDLLHAVDTGFEPDVYGVGLLWHEAVPDIVERCRVAMAETAEDLLGACAGEAYVELDSPSAAVLHAVEQRGVDLVVMATHGRTGLKRFALGSVAERVVQHAPCPVFVVKPFGKTLLPKSTAQAAGLAD